MKCSLCLRVQSQFKQLQYSADLWIYREDCCPKLIHTNKCFLTSRSNTQRPSKPASSGFTSFTPRGFSSKGDGLTSQAAVHIIRLVKLINSLEVKQVFHVDVSSSGSDGRHHRVTQTRYRTPSPHLPHPGRAILNYLQDLLHIPMYINAIIKIYIY